MKNWKACISSALLLTVVFHATRGQAPPQVIPVSPEAAALAKMVNYPINYNTGIPDIRVPFWEINVGGMKLPIELVYHAGGFRINEQATRAGLGWSLSSDLQITRTVNGKDDFMTNGYIGNPLVKAFYPNYSTCPSCAYPLNPNGQEAYWLANGDKDGAPDKFTYKLLGKSGSFYFQKNNAGTGYTIVPVPFDNIKIQYDNGAFIITDTDGTVYYFGEPGVGDVNQLLAKGIEVSGSVDWNGNCATGNCFRSAWKCKRIVNSAGTDEITFTYSNKTVAKYRTYRDYLEYYDNENPCNVGDVYYRSNMYPLNSPTMTYQSLLSTIGGISQFFKISSPKYMVYYGNSSKAYFYVPHLNSLNNVVNRAYEWNNSTNYGSSINVAGLSVSEISFRGGKVQFNGTDKLNYIRVLDGNNEELKSMHFFHSYTNAINVEQAKNFNGLNFQGTLYLDSLHVRNATNTYERYALFYENKFCYGNHLKGHDAWGYPNESTMEIAFANNVMMSLPTINIIQPRFYRDVMGGCSNFVANVPITISWENPWAEASHKTDMKRGILKRIVYPTGGFTDFDFEPNQYMEEFTGQLLLTNKVHQLSGGLRIRSINNYDENGVHKGQLYYRYGVTEEGTGLLLNKPSRTLEQGRFHYGAVSYEQEVAYLRAPDYPHSCWSTNCMNILAIEKKTTYHPASALDYTYGNGSPIYYLKVTEYKQDLGQETGKTVYEYYKPEEFHDYYAPLYRENRIPGTNISYLKTDGLMGMQKSVASYKPKTGFGYQMINKKEYEYQRYLRPEQIRVAYVFQRVLYVIAGGHFTGNTVELYTGLGFGSSLHYPGPNYVLGEYGIPSGRLLLTKETETSYEGGDSLKTVTDYVYNLPYLQPSAITTTDSKGQSMMKRVRYAYNFPGTQVYNDMVAANMISHVVEEVESNPTLGVEVARKRINYQEFPVGFGLIAPATVQSSVKGQPLSTDITFNEYDQYGNILQYTGRDGLPVSYLWGYQNLYPVAELKGVSYASIPSSYKSNVQLNNPASDAALQTLLDGLRSTFPVERLISTYSYKRLVGIQTRVAPNGQAAYYGYDPVGRLVWEKDHNQHIVAQYDYHMRGPSLPNSLTYANIPVMRSVSIPSTRHFYNHIVPGGTYLSSFNQESVDHSARLFAESLTFPEDVVVDPLTVNMAAVRLTYSIAPQVANPSQVEMDFVKDGAVVATYKFYPITTPPQQSTVYVPEGSYQLSVRVSADVNYQNGCIIYGFMGGQYWDDFDQDEIYVLEGNESYEFMITTMLYN
ncbi:hypothetical protein SAMN05421747_12721 [Parapedobacter composti]|uniref:YD repeat-containing protein n=1 Tax=Parapedobacter composti TaxID=623281 RepID=A0A1I1M9Q7_9SPHI|nr:hypothetical protein [Parapedobacter composti]SFC79323.1 hypothetical protein SAMN05421747_12721 [Parapedobacter composti]